MKEADSYDGLVTKVLENPILSDRLNLLVSRRGALNLVARDWRERLVNDEAYRKLEAGNFVQRTNTKRSEQTRIEYLSFSKDGYGDGLHLVVVAPCHLRDQSAFGKRPKNFLVYLPKSELTEAISAPFLKNVDNGLGDVTLWQHFCADHWCPGCSSARGEFTIAGQRLEFQEPCIHNTMWFDGNDVVNRFASSIRAISEKRCVAILEIRVDARVYVPTSDGYAVRVGGCWETLIAFEGLEPKLSISLGTVPRVAPRREEATREEPEDFDLSAASSLVTLDDQRFTD